MNGKIPNGDPKRGESKVPGEKVTRSPKSSIDSATNNHLFDMMAYHKSGFDVETIKKFFFYDFLRRY